MYSSLYAKAIYPAYHALIGSGAIARIRELDCHDQLASEELEVLEYEKRCRLLQFAHEYVPYYRSLIDRLNIPVEELARPESFADLPLLTKDVITSQGSQLHSEYLDENRLDPNSTSGSTGSPLHFFTDLRSKSYRKAVVVRNRKWIGINIGDPVAHIWGSPIDQKIAGAFRGRLHAAVTRETFLSAYSIGQEDFDKYANRIEQTGARLIVGYPSVLLEFARYCAEKSIRFSALKSVISSAESLYEYQRESIENDFGVPLFNRYGCREVGDIAHEVPGQKGLTINSDRIYVEVVDDEGRLCESGSTGRLVVTDLDNFGMPLIRYDIGDVGSISPCHSAVGALPYAVLTDISGRSLDLVRSVTGARVGGTFWTILFRERPGIEKFQVEQTQLEGVVVRYVKDREVDNIDTEYFTLKVREVLGPEFSVRYEPVTAIGPDPNGKYRVVISHTSDS